MRFRLFALLGTLLVGAVPMQAHHGYSAFERENTITLEGNIEEIRYMNPHSILIVKTADSQMTVEWLSLPQLRWAGINYDTLKKGDHLVLSGAPARDPAVPKMSIVRNLKRTSDGWSWPAPAPLHK